MNLTFDIKRARAITGEDGSVIITDITFFVCSAHSNEKLGPIVLGLPEPEDASFIEHPTDAEVLEFLKHTVETRQYTGKKTDEHGERFATLADWYEYRIKNGPPSPEVFEYKATPEE